MRVVVALGGNALLRRGEPLTVEAQRRNVRVACEALAPLVADHQLVVSHGNGPQVGLLALQAAGATAEDVTPLDVLGAQTEGMVGYLIEQELGNVLPFDQELATILTMVEVDPDDPAFDDPTKFIGPVYREEETERLRDRGWTFKQDGTHWRRVVPSPRPKRIFELRPVRRLVDAGCVVICTGGGGIPTMYSKDRERWLAGVEAVIDKDLASALLARELDADVFVMATDVDGVYLDWDTPDQRLVQRASPDALDAQRFPAGSMGPKVAAACEFVRTTGKVATIGALADIGRMLTGDAGTTISAGAEGVRAVPAGG